MRGRFWQVWISGEHSAGALASATRIALALGLSCILLAVAYRHFSEQRFSQANIQAGAVYSACTETRPSVDCEPEADIVFDAALRHRRIRSAAAAAGVLASAWLIVICYAALDRIVRRDRS